MPLRPRRARARRGRTVIKALKYVDVSTIEHLVELVDMQVAVEPNKNLVVIRGPDSRMETAIRLLDALDEPEPRWGIELMVHLVSAFKEPVPGSGVPAGLDSALRALRLSRIQARRHGFPVLQPGA